MSFHPTFLLAGYGRFLTTKAMRWLFSEQLNSFEKASTNMDQHIKPYKSASCVVQSHYIIWHTQCILPPLINLHSPLWGWQLITVYYTETTNGRNFHFSGLSTVSLAYALARGAASVSDMLACWRVLRIYDNSCIWICQPISDMARHP